MTNMQQLQVKAQKTAIKMPTFASILIVDDQRFDRARLRRICDQLEFEVMVSEAESLETLGTALESDKYDLIFLDYHLPDGSGLQALDAIQIDSRNRNAATIMVTGDDQSEIAIEAMKNGCSDFLMKDDLSFESVRRASINALQKASLNRNLESQEAMRSKVDVVLDHFTKQCADEMKPMLVKMMRHVRDLNSTRTDDNRYHAAIKQITASCERLFDFMSDIEDHERKELALPEVDENPFRLERTREVPEITAKTRKIFGRHPS